MALILGLQNENEAALERERVTRRQAAAQNQFHEEQRLHANRQRAANQVLQDRLRVMEKRFLEADKVTMEWVGIILTKVMALVLGARRL